MIIIQVALVQIKVSFIVGKKEINLCHAKPGFILFSDKSADQDPHCLPLSLYIHACNWTPANKITGLDKQKVSA